MTEENTVSSEPDFESAEHDALDDAAPDEPDEPDQQSETGGGDEPRGVPAPAPTSVPISSRLHRWRTMGIESLRSQPANSQNPVETEEHVKSLQQAQVRQLDQEHKQRAWFFWFAVVVVTLTLAGNFAVFAFYIRSEWRHISDTVMVTWIGATVVEVLGIAFIIATHLFPRGDKNGRRSTSTSDSSD